MHKPNQLYYHRTIHIIKNIISNIIVKTNKYITIFVMWGYIHNYIIEQKKLKIKYIYVHMYPKRCLLYKLYGIKTFIL